MAGDLRRRFAPELLMAASGFAGLGYQIVWTQQSALWLGHESAAVLAVVTAFFGGLSAGAWLLGSRIEQSAKPVRWYAVCELAIALWGLVLALALPPFSGWLLGLVGVAPSPAWQWSVAFSGTFLLLLPATAAMGATLPAMQRVGLSLRGGGSSLAALYAANTFGAVLGVLTVAFWLIPALGLRQSAFVCTALNLGCGLACLALLPRRAETAPDAPDVAAEGRRTRGLLLKLAATGLLGIGYEVLVVRVISQVTEDTVYTFALLLAIYLVGSAAGAAGYERWLASTTARKSVPGWDELVGCRTRRPRSGRGGGSAKPRGRSRAPRERTSTRAAGRAGVCEANRNEVPARCTSRPSPSTLSDALFGALSFACLLGSASLWAAEREKALALAAFGGSEGAAIFAEAVPALLAFGLPTLLMGAVFSHLARLARASGTSFGRALGVNTLGAALAPGLVGVLIAPALGPKLALLLVDVGYLALIGQRSRFRKSSWLPASVAALLLLVMPPLAFVDVPDGGHVVSYQDGVAAAVSVVEDADGVARLRINNRAQEGSSITQRVDGRQAWLPLLLHPAPHRALFLGLGTGVTAASAAEDPTLQVDAVELLPEVIGASAYFAKSVADGAGYARLQIRTADARRYVRSSRQRYDVIVSDNFHPARSGSGSLYTVEHFRAVQQRLSESGVFCQWLPLHQLDRETLRSIVKSFLAVYPQSWAMIASNSLETPVLGLVGRADARHFDAAAVRQRLSHLALREKVAGLGLEDELALLGSFVAGPSSLGRFAAGAALNTDDRPVVAYLAPRITYAPDSSPSERFIALLHELSIAPDELLAPPSDPSLARRVPAYWAARDRFIEAGRNVKPSPSAQEMLALVGQPLLSVLRQSPDFRPAYDPLLSLASALSRSNVSAARTLLTELTRIQPARTEAAQVLTLIGADAASVDAGR